jgi:arsenate reductase-like glutaredoxin family protein
MQRVHHCTPLYVTEVTKKKECLMTMTEEEMQAQLSIWGKTKEEMQAQLLIWEATEREMDKMHAQLLTWEKIAKDAVILTKGHEENMQEYEQTIEQLTSSGENQVIVYSALQKKCDTLIAQKRVMSQVAVRMEEIFNQSNQDFAEQKADWLRMEEMHVQFAVHNLVNTAIARVELQQLLDTSTAPLVQTEAQLPNTYAHLASVQHQLVSAQNAASTNPVILNEALKMLVHALKVIAIPGAIGFYTGSVIQEKKSLSKIQSLSKLLEDTRKSNMSHLTSKRVLTVQVPPPFVEVCRLIPLL